ncbi:hypothetical protein TOK_4009 [Pseudonocardia sp. N23]|nr:hypothetical protein TOK_4009 [Pseudonocardia sp. N23]
MKCSGRSENVVRRRGCGRASRAVSRLVVPRPGAASGRWARRRAVRSRGPDRHACPAGSRRIDVRLPLFLAECVTPALGHRPGALGDPFRHISPIGPTGR